MDLLTAGGVIPVDKPTGPTSHDVVAVARRLLGTPRVGHTGTLDPLATGLLLLCVGPTTRLVQFLVGLPKDYLARVRLGVRTTTDDPEGDVEATSEGWRDLDPGTLDAALGVFRGRTWQTPPRFSAKKIGGEAAHYRARRGEAVALAPVEVDVLDLELLEWQPPDLEIRVCCSSGTYVRALARDLGEVLGTGAHLSALRRTAIGKFRVEGAVTLAGLGDPSLVERACITPAAAVAHLPRVEVGPEDAVRLSQGQAVAFVGPVASSPLPDSPVAVLSGRRLVAVAEREGERLRPRKVFPVVAS
jgi:tRNA pseudouridine55 synthase